MAIPVLKLNLAPEPSLWRQNHEALGWGAVGLGTLLLLSTSAFTGWKYLKATREASQSVRITAEARKVASEQAQLVNTLRSVDVSTEMPRWRLAERILSERSLPWSRLTAELERSLVQDVRIKSIQRTRGADQSVQLALKGEARSRDAEVKFIERLQGNSVFTQVLMEREAERQGGGLDFELKLPATTTPRPYEPLPEPEYAPRAAQPAQAPARSASPRTPAPAQPAAPKAPAPRDGGPGGRSLAPAAPSQSQPIILTPALGGGRAPQATPPASGPLRQRGLLDPARMQLPGGMPAGSADSRKERP
jgi:hypothetical protein